MDKIQQQDLISLLVLQRLPDTAAVTLQTLFATFHTLSGIMQASSAGLASILSESALSQFEQYRRKNISSVAGQQACRDLEYIQQHDIALVTIESDVYPPQLQEIYHAPPLFMVQGNVSILSSEQIAVIGSRRASPSGLEHAYHFAAELASSGLVVTSGLALGIDGAAHRGALSVDADLNPAPTIAVIATGLDLCYPSRHEKLREEIVQRGAMVSEFPLGTPPQKENFPRRNRIISGLSKGVLVVEAEEKSGSLITARYALEQNREVFAIPGSINNPASRGCHQLIRDGAKLVENTSDVLTELEHPFGQIPMAVHPAREVKNSKKVALKAGVPETDLTQEEKSLLAHIDENPVTVDQLAVRASMEANELLSLLTNLELKDFVFSSHGAYQKSKITG